MPSKKATSKPKPKPKAKVSKSETKPETDSQVSKPETKPKQHLKSEYVEISVERRKNAKIDKARYNQFKTLDNKKEYFSRKSIDLDKKKSSTQSAKSQNELPWEETMYESQEGVTEKTQKKTKYSDYTPANIFRDFPEVNPTKLVIAGDDEFKQGGSRTRKHKKSSTKKRSTKKLSTKKRSTKKLSAKKRSTKKAHKKSRKKSSHKK